jgi:YggT family protein
MTLMAITRVDVADYLQTLLYVYMVLIFVRILLTWIPRIPYNRVLNAVIGFINDVTDPYLNLFRRFLPPVRIGPGALDLSPTVGIIVLIVVGGIIVRLVRGY